MNKKEPISDTELVERVLADDEKAVLHFFYEKFYSVFEYHVYKIFPYEQSVQELVHEFFLYLRQDDWRRLRSYNSEKAKLNTWVSVISFRFFLNFKKTKIDSNGFITIFEQWDDKILQYKNECEEQVRMDVGRAIESLKNETERKVARRLILEEADVQDVANENNLSVDYTYTVKSRAVSHLRIILKDYRS